MNAFEDDQTSVVGEYVTADSDICCTRRCKRRIKNLCWFLLGACITGGCLVAYATVEGFGTSSNTPQQTYPGKISITESIPISGSTCIIEWEKTFVSNNYRLLLFQLGISDNAQNYEPVPLDNSGFDFKRTISGLRSSSTYMFRLRGCADVGCGNFTYKTCRTETPSVPQTPEVPQISSVKAHVSTKVLGKVNALDISFNMTSTDNGGAAITNMELRYTNVSNSWPSNALLGCSFNRSCEGGCNCTVPISLPRLGPETFTFRTRASNIIGKSSWSAPTQCIIFKDSNKNPVCVVMSPPAAPEIASYNIASNVSIQWTAGLSVNAGASIFFEVWMSDPWNGREEVIQIRNVTSEQYENNTVLPDTVYKFAVRAFDFVGRPGGMTKDLKFQTPVQGNCGNYQDIVVLKQQWNSASKYSYKCWVQDCLGKTTPAGQKCTEDCISRVVGFSLTCSTCWYSRTVCLATACYDCLINPDKCQACYEEHCLGSYLNCTGLPSYASPPAKLGNFSRSY